jgi:drug/metabolite transporter (DMT)-like permease
MSRVLLTLLLVISFNCIVGNKPCSNLQENKISLILVRSVFNLATFASFYIAYEMVGLGLSLVVWSLTPVWTSILSTFNGEKAPKTDYLMILVCLGCVIGVGLNKQDNTPYNY